MIAAYWIQFMTHDWFTHMEEARNDRTRTIRDWAAQSERVNNVEQADRAGARRASSAAGRKTRWKPA